MARRRAFAAALVALTLPAAATDPVFGTWTWVPDGDAGSATDKCYVTSMEDLGNGKFRETSTRVRANGKVVKQDTVSAFDGFDHPSGLGNGMTAAFNRIDQNRYAITLKKDGKSLATVMRTVSADGNGMTQVVNGTADGKPFSEIQVFARKDGSCEGTP